MVTMYRAQSKQAVIDSTMGEVLSESELSAFQDQIVAFASGKTAIVSEVLEERFDGKPMWVRNRVTIHPQHFEDWSLVLFAVTDITGTMEMDRAIGPDLSRLSDVLSNLPCALYRRELKPDGTVNYPYMNGLGRLLPGHGPNIDDDILLSEAIVGGVTVHEDDAGRWSLAWRQSAQMLSPVDLEYRVVDPSGKSVWLRNIATPKHGNGGVITWDGAMIRVVNS